MHVLVLNMKHAYTKVLFLPHTEFHSTPAASILN